eukprot:scaffold39923_cov64-Phaeocystis_antarctica.AAC.12
MTARPECYACSVGALEVGCSRLSLCPVGEADVLGKVYAPRSSSGIQPGENQNRGKPEHNQIRWLDGKREGGGPLRLREGCEHLISGWAARAITKYALLRYSYQMAKSRTTPKECKVTSKGSGAWSGQGGRLDAAAGAVGWGAPAAAAPPPSCTWPGPALEFRRAHERTRKSSQVALPCPSYVSAAAASTASTPAAFAPAAPSGSLPLRFDRGAVSTSAAAAAAASSSSSSYSSSSSSSVSRTSSSRSPRAVVCRGE